MSEYCVSCGSILPEGRQICHACEVEYGVKPEPRRRAVPRRLHDSKTGGMSAANSIRAFFARALQKEIPKKI